MSNDRSTVASAGIVHALNALNAFSTLLNCVDPAKWDTLARPHAHGLADLHFTLIGDLEAQLAEQMDLSAIRL
jgi:hypothetical protein